MSNHNSHVTREKVYEDVKVLIHDVQELLKATTSVVGDKAGEARARVQDHLKVVQDKLGDHYDTVRTKARKPSTPPTAMSPRTHGTPSASPRASVPSRHRFLGRRLPAPPR